MHDFPGPIRELLFHPQLESLGLILRESGVPEPLGRNHRNELYEKFKRHLFGQTRRNTDYKHMAGYADWGLVELRWDWVIGGKRTPVRLIGSEIDSKKTIFCVWHIKNLDMDLERQREEQNLACARTIERVVELAKLNA